MSKNMKIFWICIISFLLLCWLVSCSLENSSSSGSSYKSNKYELTQQEKDNLEFYYEMEEAWNKYRK